MNKPKIQVLVEVTAEVVMNGRKQVAYVHLGSQYPEKMEVWIPDEGQPYKPGNYMLTECFMSNEKYPRLVIGTNRLQAVKSAA